MSKSSKTVSSTVSNNKGVSMKKSKLVINDLANEMSNLYWSASFGMESSENFSYSQDEEGNIEPIQGFRVDTTEFLLNQSELENGEDADKLALYKSSAAKVYGNEEFGSEISELVALQNIDLEQAPNAKASHFNRTVVVKVQRLSDSGNWYNAKDNDGVIWYSFPVEAIFTLDDNGNIEDLKVNANGQYTVLADMAEYGFSDMHIMKFTDKVTGEKNVKFVEQRFVMSSVLFTSRVSINGVKLPSIAGGFRYSYDVEAKQVIEKRTSFAYDNMVEISHDLVIIPSDLDMPQGDIDAMLFNEGILTGSGESTAAMLMEDMHRDEMEQNAKEEKHLNSIAKKVQMAHEYKKASIASNYSKVLESDAGFVAAQLIEGSYTKDLKQLKVVFEAIQNYGDLEALHAAVVAHRVVNGKGLEYKAWTHLLECRKNLVRKEIATTIDKSVAQNILALNKGLPLSKFSDSEVVEMYDAALKYRKTNAAYSINIEVYRDVQARACAIKGVKSATEFVRNGKVTTTKVG